MPTIITPDLDITPQGTLVRMDQKMPELVGGKVPVDLGGTQINIGASVEVSNDAGNPLPISDAGSSITVDNRSSTPVVTFNRPNNTTQYNAGDVVGSDSTANHTATAAGVNGSLIQIQSASLLINNTSPPANMTTFRIHLWNAAPAAIADNAAFAAAAADRAKYCGFIDLPQIAAVGGGFLWTFADYVGRPIRLASTSFVFNIVTNGNYQPAAQTEYQVRFQCIEVGA